MGIRVSAIGYSRNFNFEFNKLEITEILFIFYSGAPPGLVVCRLWMQIEDAGGASESVIREIDIILCASLLICLPSSVTPLGGSDSNEKEEDSFMKFSRIKY